MRLFARSCVKQIILIMIQTQNIETGRDFRDFSGQPTMKVKVTSKRMLFKEKKKKAKIGRTNPKLRWYKELLDP